MVSHECHFPFVHMFTTSVRLFFKMFYFLKCCLRILIYDLKHGYINPDIYFPFTIQNKGSLLLLSKTTIACQFVVQKLFLVDFRSNYDR